MANTEQIPGPSGDLEVWTTPSVSATPGTARWAVLCHPHPQYGGSMHDGVLESASQALTDAGIHTLRFNFRGVGQSAGRFDHGVGEIDDAQAVLTWLEATHAPQQQLLVGYSFGAAVAWGWAARQAALDKQGAVAALWLLAPPVSLFEPVAPVTDPLPPLQIFHPEADNYTSAASLREWQTINAPEAELHWVAGADHFFSGQQAELGKLCRAAAGALPTAT